MTFINKFDIWIIRRIIFKITVIPIFISHDMAISIIAPFIINVSTAKMSEYSATR